MAGHSQFKNIVHRKSAQDAKRAKIFVKLSQELQVAIQKGGPNPHDNPALRLVISKAQMHNMPKSNYLKIIAKYKASKPNLNIDQYCFAGSLPHGVFVIVECWSDNHNRITSEIKSYFSHAHGSLVKNHAVSHLFTQLGLFQFKISDYQNFDENQLLEGLLIFDLIDFSIAEHVVTIKTAFQSFGQVQDFLVQHVTTFIVAETKYEPLHLVTFPATKMKLYNRFFSALENNKDVKRYYYNFSNDLQLTN